MGESSRIRAKKIVSHSYSFLFDFFLLSARSFVYFFSLLSEIFIMRVLFFLMGRNLKLSTNSEWEEYTLFEWEREQVKEVKDTLSIEILHDNKYIEWMCRLYCAALCSLCMRVAEYLNPRKSEKKKRSRRVPGRAAVTARGV